MLGVSLSRAGPQFGDNMADKCIGIKVDGTPCKANASRGTAYCIWHDPDISDEEKYAMRAKGGQRARYQNLPPSRMPVVEAEETEDMVIPVLQRAVEQLESMQVSPSTMATLGNVASALDRAIARREARGANVTRIEVVYVNDWRGE